MEIISVDDCIKSIKLEDNNILYYRTSNNCIYDENDNKRNEEYYFEQIPYELSQKLNIEIYDLGGQCFLKAYVKVNDYKIYTNKKNFWKCENSQQNSLNQVEGDLAFHCYNDGSNYPFDEGRYFIFHYYFQLDSILQLGLNMQNIQDISEYLSFYNHARG